MLNGWFTGVYYGMGLYDVQWKAKGYQGESVIGVGITGGYNHKIGKNLSMEYGLGVGYFKTHYRHYESWFGFDERWHPIKTNNGRYSWFGPTRVRVSLVWMLNYKSKKGGIQ